MLLVICYLFYFVAATISPLQRRKLSLAGHGSGYAPAFAFRVSIVVACLGLLLPFFSAPELKGGPLKLFLLALTCGLFGAVAISSQYWAQRHVEAGITVLAGNIYTPVTIILATFLLGEGLTLMQFAGTALLLTSIMVVSKKHHLGKLRFDKYFMAMILSGAALGVALTAERALLNTTGFTTGTLLSWWAQVIGLGLAALWYGTKTTYTPKETLVTGSLRFLQLFSWVLLVYVADNLSVASAVTTFKVVVIFVFAAIFLHEREDLTRKIIGSLIAVVGLLLMI
jgi:drug/metabolite transporter (DMT)-like permease